MKTIDEIYTEHPYFGARRMSKHLVRWPNLSRLKIGNYEI
jgi:hypothetical protein